MGCTKWLSNLSQPGRCLVSSEEAVADRFLGEVFLKLRSLLQRHSPTGPYTRAVLLCAGWPEVEVLLSWLRLSDRSKEFASSFHSVGVVGECGGGVMSGYSSLTGWHVGQMGLMEEALALHTLATGGGQADLQQRLLKDTITVEEALLKPLPGPGGGDVCAVVVQWLEVNGRSEMTQLGAALLPAGGGEEVNKTFLSRVLPSTASADKALFSDLHLHRRPDGQIECQPPGAPPVPVVSELEALLALFQWMRRCSTSTCLLLTPSSHLGLTVLLRAVQRQKLEHKFYQQFIGFTDLHAITMDLQPSWDLHNHGLPNLPTLSRAAHLATPLPLPEDVAARLSLLYLLHLVAQEQGETLRYFQSPTS